MTIVIAFAAISTVGMFGSSEMQAGHDRHGSSFDSSLTSIPDNDQPDHLEDLVAWDNFGSFSSSAVLAAFALLLLLATLAVLPRFQLFTPDSVPPVSELYTKPPGFSLALQEAFSSGLLNGKAF